MLIKEDYFCKDDTLGELFLQNQKKRMIYIFFLYNLKGVI